MRIWFTKELTASGVIKLMKKFNNLRSMNFKLFKGYTRNRQGNFESTLVCLSHIDKSIQCRNVRFLYYLIYTLLICIVIIIIVISSNLEETISFQMYNLMYFKIESYCFHIELFLLFSIVC